MIAITGHTKGFGKFLFDNLPNTIGFSKSNGFDITLKSDRLEIIKKAQDCSVFINNAQNGFSQTEMLYDAFEQWSTDDKLVINIGSRSKDFTLRERHSSFGYSVEKLALEHAGKQLSFINNINITSIHFGRLELISYEEAILFVNLAIECHKKKLRLIDIHVSHDR